MYSCEPKKTQIDSSSFLIYRNKYKQHLAKSQRVSKNTLKRLSPTPNRIRLLHFLLVYHACVLLEVENNGDKHAACKPKVHQ